MQVSQSRGCRAIGVKDNMALVGILSTQLVVEQFVRDFARRCNASGHFQAETTDPMPGGVPACGSTGAR